MPKPVPYSWSVSGVLLHGFVPFNQCNVCAFNKVSSENLEQISETGVAADRYFMADLSENSESLKMQIWRTLPNYNDEKTKRFVKDLSKGAKYWRFLPFFANADADKSILLELAHPTPHDLLPDKKALQLLIDKWKNDPFNPHLIARHRLAAYQKYVVMKYLDILIAWGDQLFSQDTTESVNLAIQMYILAANVLGPKSAIVPDPKTEENETIEELMLRGNDIMNNAFVTYKDTMLVGHFREKYTPQRLLRGNTTQLSQTSGMMFYFNVPRNENLMAYWDTVADRLYKIRNSMNIEGVKRTLALFAAPIDPAMLIKAKAAGVSISEALTQASTALPCYRFKVMVAKAIEIVHDVQQVGRDLLAALEKKDGETLAQMRIVHEKTVLDLQKNITDIELNEVEKELEIVETEEENLLVEQKLQEEHSKTISLEEEYKKVMDKVKNVQELAEDLKKAASAARNLPDLDVGGILNGLGGPSFDTFASGGTKLADALMDKAESYVSKFAQKQISAAMIKLQGEAERKVKEWTERKTQKENKIKEISKKKITAQIRIDYAKKQVNKFEKEYELKDEMYNYLKEKYTNKDLYTWLKKELGNIYKNMFSLAVKVASMAEACYHFEIGDKDLNETPVKDYIKKSGEYWSGLYSGLLAGEKLLFDLHNMEVAYLENDKNELEITRPISLKEEEIIENNFDKFIQDVLTTEGGQFIISKNIFDNDFPNHDFRRIRDVRLEIITSDCTCKYLNAELTLMSDQNNPTIATSTAHKDCGKFMFDLKRNKFSPFEGASVNSTWKLSITGFKNFEPEGSEFKTSPIDDVIIYISYTARKGNKTT